MEVDVGPEDFGDAAGDGRRDAGGIRGGEQGGVDPGRARDEAALQHVVLDAGFPLAVLERQHQLLRRGLALAVVGQGIGQRLDAVLLVERGVDGAARRQAQEFARRGVTAHELDERHVLLAELAQQMVISRWKAPVVGSGWGASDTGSMTRACGGGSSVSGATAKAVSVATEKAAPRAEASRLPGELCMRGVGIGLPGLRQSENRGKNWAAAW